MRKAREAAPLRCSFGNNHQYKWLSPGRVFKCEEKHVKKTAYIYRHIVGPWIFFSFFFLDHDTNENIPPPPISSWFSAEAERKLNVFLGGRLHSKCTLKCMNRTLVNMPQRPRTLTNKGRSARSPTNRRCTAHPPLRPLKPLYSRVWIYRKAAKSVSQTVGQSVKL